MKKVFFVTKIVLFLVCYALSTSSSIAQNLINLFRNTAESGIWYDVVGTIESTEPQFTTHSDELLIREGYKTLTVQPATFIDSPGSGTIEYTDLEVIGAQWALATEQVLVHTESVRWERCSNHHNLWRKLETPTEYQTIVRQVVTIPAHVIEVVKTVTDKQIVTPASIIERDNAPVYQTFSYPSFTSDATLTGTISSYSLATRTCRGRY